GAAHEKIFNGDGAEEQHANAREEDRKPKPTPTRQESTKLSPALPNQETTEERDQQGVRVVVVPPNPLDEFEADTPVERGEDSHEDRAKRGDLGANRHGPLAGSRQLQDEPPTFPLAGHVIVPNPSFGTGSK